MDLPTPESRPSDGVAEHGVADFAGPPPPSISRVFFGDQGLRAIWGILLFISFRQAFVSSIYPLALTFMASPSVTSAFLLPRSVFVYEGVGLLGIVLATVLMSRIEHRPISTYGFNQQRSVPRFCAGLASGVILLSLLIGFLSVSGLLVFDGRMLYGGGALRYGFIWLAGFLLVALAEEIFTRGYLQFTLTRGLSAFYGRMFGISRANTFGFWSAALILSFAFGLGHRFNPGESPLGLLSAGVAGLLFCLSLWRTGSLWWAIGFHTSWDWAQSFLFGVADSGLMVQGHLYATHPVGRPILSGGLTGPEGSLFMLLVMAVAAGVIVWTLPRSHFGYMPREAPEPSLH